MAIGKNAIKRVENNGYSKVKTGAPDMENSTVIANLSEEVMEKMVKPVEKKTAKKCVKKTTETKAEKPVAKKTTKKTAKTVTTGTENSSKNGFNRVEVGNDMPYYLL